ncbi:hypothetical protein FKQ14_20910 [Salmonella enterica]|nr:hypothetical protein [Salmonella enterica]EDF3626199.1 hypothetical protein [Salmonella enterica subsp. enterica serovar Newport]EGI5202409.1 hypothetical protein [Salmonella enterica subsp. enterica serovar Cubana]EBP9096562.1 hypothetical protein [Salmonella enterica]EDD2598032.1 hypothetical protein [Salmonella enterica]
MRKIILRTDGLMRTSTPAPVACGNRRLYAPLIALPLRFSSECFAGNRNSPAAVNFLFRYM